MAKKSYLSIFMQMAFFRYSYQGISLFHKHSHLWCIDSVSPVIKTKERIYTMKKIFKWIGIVVGVCVILLAIAAFLAVNSYRDRATTVYQVTPPTIELPDDSLSLARGEELVRTCRECHGKDLGGMMRINDPVLGKIYGTNLTAGKGGIGAMYTTTDWLRAIRHGIAPDGRPLRLMPAHDYIYLGKEDIGSLIAYLKTVPRVDRENQPTQLTPMGKIIVVMGGAGAFFPAEHIDHRKPFDLVPERSATPVYGEYLVNISGCKSCHKENLAGGKSPVPNSPLARNLTPAGNIGNWSLDDFIRTMRTGVTPEGKQLDNKFMPYQVIGTFPDDDLKAIYLFLQSLPPTTGGE